MEAGTEKMLPQPRQRCEAAAGGRPVVGRGSGAGWRATPGGREGRPSGGSIDWISEEGWALLDP
jgi:hypothetical protein